VGGQPVVMVVVPQKSSTDPRTFYIMENKVWNDLYAAFVADPASRRLLQKYHDCPGCDQLVRLVQDDWKKGGLAPESNQKPFFGVDGPEKGMMPVLRVTVTEAHCFAEWEQIGGRLPTRQQWFKAAGLGEDDRLGPYDGKPEDPTDLAINQKNGPWPVNRGNRDLSIHGCRQMASNGQEWTRDVTDPPGSFIPLNNVLVIPWVWMVGKSYLADTPLTFKDAQDNPLSAKSNTADFQLTFRVVLEQ
jgi:formylglycine-generating enzyme required for sulfatase activity